MIEEYFGDGSKFGCSIRYSHEDSPLGSGGALWSASEFLEDEFLYINGDDYLEIDYTELINAFHNQNVSAMVAVREDARGRLDIEKKTYRVIDFVSESNLYLHYLDCGTKVFKKTIIDMIDPCYPFVLEQSLWPILIEKKQLYIFPFMSKNFGIDTFEKLTEFKLWLKQQKYSNN